MNTHTGVAGLSSGQYDLSSEGERLVPSGQLHPLLALRWTSVSIGLLPWVTMEVRARHSRQALRPEIEEAVLGMSVRR